MSEEDLNGLFAPDYAYRDLLDEKGNPIKKGVGRNQRILQERYKVYVTGEFQFGTEYLQGHYVDPLPYNKNEWSYDERDETEAYLKVAPVGSRAILRTTWVVDREEIIELVVKVDNNLYWAYGISIGGSDIGKTLGLKYVYTLEELQSKGYYVKNMFVYQKRNSQLKHESFFIILSCSWNL